MKLRTHPAYTYLRLVTKLLETSFIRKLENNYHRNMVTKKIQSFLLCLHHILQSHRAIVFNYYDGHLRMFW